MMTALQASPHYALGDLIMPSAETWNLLGVDSGAQFPYIEISAVGLGTNEYSVQMLPVAEAPSRARMVVYASDILVSTTRPHRGAIVTVKPEDDGAIASTGFAVLRDLLRNDVSRSFLLTVLNSPGTLEQFRQRSSGGNYPAITQDELLKVLIPFVPSNVQQSLVADMDAAREARRDTLARADALLSGLDGYLLEQLGLTAAIKDERQTFAVRLNEISGRRIDPPAYRPFFAKGKPLTTPTQPLYAVADIDANRTNPPLDEAEMVPYVGLPECSLTEVREVTLRPYSEVKGRSILRSSDILFARIEPSVFNKKYVLADDLKGYDYAYTSTEFYTVSAKPLEAIQGYLYAMFFCSFVFAQVRGKTTGSSGRRRIDPELFANLQIPIPEMAVQQAIADEVGRRRASARRLRQQAEADWAAAKARFERRLLGERNPLE